MVLETSLSPELPPAGEGLEAGAGEDDEPTAAGEEVDAVAGAAVPEEPGGLEGLLEGSTGYFGAVMFAPARYSSAVIPGTVHLVSGYRSS